MRRYHAGRTTIGGVTSNPSLVRYKRENARSIMCPMEYVTTTSGERRRVHREYVDVYCRMGRDGTILPVRALWLAGRSFPVDEVVEAGGFGAVARGRQTARYRVRMGRHERTSTSSAASPCLPPESPSGSCGGSTPTTRLNRELDLPS